MQCFFRVVSITASKIQYTDYYDTGAGHFVHAENMNLSTWLIISLYNEISYLEKLPNVFPPHR